MVGRETGDRHRSDPAAGGVDLTEVDGVQLDHAQSAIAQGLGRGEAHIADRARRRIVVPGFEADAGQGFHRPLELILVGEQVEVGAKGVGESGTIGATPAVQNAVVDALSHLGVKHVEIPCTPRRVWQAIQEATA